MYYTFSKNSISETQQVEIHLSLLDENKEEIESFTSKTLTLQPDETNKVLFDNNVINLPNWMQHSFYLSTPLTAYQYDIEVLSKEGSE